MKLCYHISFSVLHYTFLLRLIFSLENKQKSRTKISLLSREDAVLTLSCSVINYHYSKCNKIDFILFFFFFLNQLEKKKNQICQIGIFEKKKKTNFFSPNSCLMFLFHKKIHETTNYR